MATHLVGLRLSEISFVDKGANPGAKVVLFKRLSGSPAAKPVRKSMTLEEALALLPDDAKAVVTQALQAKAAEKTEDEPEDMAKRKDLPEDVRKALADQRAEKEALEKRLALLEEGEQQRAFTEIAKSIGRVHGLAPDELAQVLRLSKKSMPEDLSTKLTDHFRGSAELVKKSELFGERGSGRESDDEGSAGARIESVAKALRDSDPKLTKAQAYSKALSQNPELYAAHERERATKGAR
jgi:hypothetical protein